MNQEESLSKISNLLTLTQTNNNKPLFAVWYLQKLIKSSIFFPYIKHLLILINIVDQSTGLICCFKDKKKLFLFWWESVLCLYIQDCWNVVKEMEVNFVFYCLNFVALYLIKSQCQSNFVPHPYCVKMKGKTVAGLKWHCWCTFTWRNIWIYAIISMKYSLLNWTGVYI